MIYNSLCDSAPQNSADESSPQSESPKAENDDLIEEEEDLELKQLILDRNLNLKFEQIDYEDIKVDNVNIKQGTLVIPSISLKILLKYGLIFQ